MYSSFFLSLFFLLSIFSNNAFAARYSGMVVDNEGKSVSNAIVQLQGTPFVTSSDSMGRFILSSGDDIPASYITAWKSGFYNGGQPVSAGKKEYKIVLQPVPIDDNPKYMWQPSLQLHTSPATDKEAAEKPCRECHPALTEQWQGSAHSRSAVNPVFLRFFNGGNGQETSGGGPGYKLDFPHSNGNCATCHAPVLAFDNPFNADPNLARDVAKEGVSCDFCHKINSVIVDQGGGRPGVLSIQFKRPPEGRQIFYGPYTDVFPGDDSYHPLYTQSRYCAPCHHGKFWDVLMYSEFQEWTESRYARDNIQCQDCHMKADGSMTRFALEDEGGILRAPETIPSHTFFGTNSKTFMREAIELTVQEKLNQGSLRVTVTIKNMKAGHHYPTGNPMRNLILVVGVTDDTGHPLTLSKGEKVPVWGGVGDVAEGNYAGFPGKGFAKVLKDVIPYPHTPGKNHFQRQYPAPHWRPVLIESDTRIPADGKDISEYYFQVPESLSGSLHITSTLLYRRAYKKWMDAHGLDIPDMEIARENIRISR